MSALERERQVLELVRMGVHEPKLAGVVMVIPDELHEALGNLTGPELDVVAAVAQVSIRRHLEELHERLRERTARLGAALHDGAVAEERHELEAGDVGADGQDAGEASPPVQPVEPDPGPPTPAGEASDEDSPPADEPPADEPDPEPEPDDATEPDVLQALEELGEPATVNKIARHLGMHYSASGVLRPSDRSAIDAALAEAFAQSKVRTAGTYKRGTLWELVPEGGETGGQALEQRAPTKAEREDAAAESLREEVYRALANGSMFVPAIATKIDRKPAEVAHAIQQLQKAGKVWKVPGGAYDRVHEPSE